MFPWSLGLAAAAPRAVALSTNTPNVAQSIDLQHSAKECEHLGNAPAAPESRSAAASPHAAEVLCALAALPAWLQSSSCSSACAPAVAAAQYPQGAITPRETSDRYPAFQWLRGNKGRIYSSPAFEHHSELSGLHQLWLTWPQHRPSPAVQPFLPPGAPEGRVAPGRAHHAPHQCYVRTGFLLHAALCTPMPPSPSHTHLG